MTVTKSAFSQARSKLNPKAFLLRIQIVSDKFSRKITKPLLYDNSCDFIKSGTIVLTKNNNTIITDYGDGTCDSVATVTTNGTTETIDLTTFRFPDGGHFDKNCPGGPHQGPGQNQGQGKGGFRFGF